MDLLLTVLGWCGVAALGIVFVAVAVWTWGQWRIVTELATERAQRAVHVAPSPTLFSRHWQAQRERFAALIEDENFPAALIARAQVLEAVNVPTAEFKAVVARNFGVRLDEVGPRELDCTRTEGWTQPTFEFGVVTR